MGRIPFLFILPLLAVTLRSAIVYGQTAALSWSIGPVLEIYPDFPTSKGSNRLSLYLGKNQVEPNLWNRAYRYPLTGLKLSYFDLGSSILGKAVGIQYQFLKLQDLSERLQFQYGLALGGIYFTNPYNYLDNPENIASGGHLSFLPELVVGLDYSLNNYLSTAVSFNFYHTSNGHAQLPNVGLNVPSLQLGIQYHLSETDKKSPVDIESDEWQKKWQVNGRISLGVNEFGGATGPTNGPKNEIYLTSLYASKRYSPSAFIQIGVDAYYNSGYRRYISAQEIDEISSLKDNFTDASVLLVFLGHEYIYAHFGMVVQVGYNLHNPFLKYYIKEDEGGETSSLKAKLPGKFGVKYYLKNPFKHENSNVYFGVFIKSNVSQADFLESGIGIRL